MKLLTTNLIAIIALGLCAAPLALADDASFVGKWKLNPDKSQFNGLPYKIEDAGHGQYRFIFGDDVETLTLDGKGHVTKYGDTWSIKATGPNSWESTNKRDGKVTAKSKWTVSEDGKTFTTMDENMRPDGSTGQTESTLTRTDGTSGLAGTWESKSVKIMSPLTIEIAKWQEDGYASVTRPTNNISISSSTAKITRPGATCPPKAPPSVPARPTIIWS